MALSTVLLGYTIDTVALAAASTALVGLFLGVAGSGSIAIASIIYPTAIRVTGIGWGIGIGRLGQVVLPLIASWLLARSDGQYVLPTLAAMLGTSIVAILLLGPFALRREKNHLSRATPAAHGQRRQISGSCPVSPHHAACDRE